MSPRLARAIVGRRAWVLAITLIVAVVCALGALRLQVDVSSASFYGDDAGDARTLERFVQRFGPDDDLLVAVVELPHDLSSARASIASVSAAARSTAGVRSVRSLTTELDRLGLSGLDDSSFSAAALRRSPVVPLLVSEDLKTAAVLIRLEHSTDDLARALPVVRRVHDSLSATRIPVALAGVPAVRAGFYERVLADQRVFAPLTFGLIAVGLALAFGRVHAVAVGLLAAGTPTLVLAGTFGWVGVPIGLLNQIDFTLIPVLAVAAYVHVLMRIHHEHAHGSGEPPDPHARVVEAMGAIARPVVLTVATTAIGFGSLGAASMPVLRSFGAWSAFGMLVVGAVTLVVVPAALATTTLRPIAARPRLKAAVRATARRAARAPKLVLLGCSAVIVVAGIGAAKVEVDNRLGSLLDPEHAVSRANATLDDSLGGSLSLELMATGPAARSALDAVAARARSHPDVRAVLGPETAEATRDPPTARLSLRTADHGARRFTSLMTDARGWADESLATSATTSIDLTGTAAIAYAGVDAIAHSLRRSLALAVALVSLVIGVAFRSWRVLAIATVVNGLPLVVGYAALGWWGRAFDPVPAAILVLALGIAVDDTIHLLDRARALRRSRGEDHDSAAAVEEAAGSSGVAVTVTTLAVLAGLGVNLFASFPALQLLGALGCFVLAAAWLADLIVLPALFVLAQR